MTTNYFATRATARRYAGARPDLNRLFNARLLTHTGRVETALDLGCGTGLSSRALAEVSDTIIGVDPSIAMLAEAEPHRQVKYCAGFAEAVPLADRSVQLVSVGLALHWFDRARFHAEVERVVQPGGWLFIYNTWFCGRMRDRPEFHRWVQEAYLRKYPVPPRHGEPPAAGGALELRDTWNVEADVPMTPEQLAMYLTTQSNVTAMLDRGDQTLADATRWLIAEVESYFHGAREAFLFAGTAWLLRVRE